MVTEATSVALPHPCHPFPLACMAYFPLNALLPLPVAGHPWDQAWSYNLGYDVASRKPFQGNIGCGFVPRRGPRGGAANGTPRNTFTGMALPSTAACFPRTHPSLVFRMGASLVGPEGTHRNTRGGIRNRELARNKLNPELSQLGALFLRQETVEQEVSGFLLKEPRPTASFTIA